MAGYARNSVLMTNHLAMLGGSPEECPLNKKENDPTEEDLCPEISTTRPLTLGHAEYELQHHYSYLSISVHQ